MGLATILTAMFTTCLFIFVLVLFVPLLGFMYSQFALDYHRVLLLLGFFSFYVYTLLCTISPQIQLKAKDISRDSIRKRIKHFTQKCQGKSTQSSPASVTFCQLSTGKQYTGGYSPSVPAYLYV